MSTLRRWITSTAVLIATLSLATTSLAGSGWTLASAPGTNTNAVIFGAFARTDADVWGVGTEFGPAGSAPSPPITYHWNGKTWSRFATPSLSSGAGLLAVSASSVTDAWAVGFTQSGGYRNNQSLFEHWNGNNWSVVAGTDAGRLVGVVDFSQTNAWAVSTKGVLEHWNGAGWSIVTTPQPNPDNTFGNRATSMSSTGPTDIWVVGKYTTPSYTDEAYSLHYNGKTWNVVPMRQPANGSLVLGAVAALSPTNAWAIGQAGSTQVIAEHWNGKTWTLSTIATDLVYPATLAIAARSTSDIWTFGNQNVNNQHALLLMHWNGKTWSKMPNPTITGYSDLYAAAATLTGAYVWALGVGGADYQPLIVVHP